MGCSDGSRGGEGVAEIQFYASDGAPRLRIEVRDPGIATIQLLGPQYSESINIAVDPDRGSGIGIYNAEHRPVVNLGVRYSAGDRPDFIPNASLQVIDTGNNQVWSLPPMTAPSDKRTQTRDG